MENNTAAQRGELNKNWRKRQARSVTLDGARVLTASAFKTLDTKTIVGSNTQHFINFLVYSFPSSGQLLSLLETFLKSIVYELLDSAALLN